MVEVECSEHVIELLPVARGGIERVEDLTGRSCHRMTDYVAQWGCNTSMMLQSCS
jgi:hypothetical protein